MTSSTTAFDVAYLREVCTDIDLGRSFRELSERFCRLHGDNESSRSFPYKTRLEDGYFIYKLIDGQLPVLEFEKDPISKRLNIEKACKQAVELSTIRKEWLQHQCHVKGCKEGFVMCDGNEKLGRRICAASREYYQLMPNLPRTISCCPFSPVFSGQHIDGSKYCRDHAFLDVSDAKRSRIVVKINLKDQTVSTEIARMSHQLPRNDDPFVNSACKKPENIQKFYKRTAGVMAIVRPCGFVVDFREMFTCESASQLFIQLVNLVDQPNANIHYIGYDRACEFHPFLLNLSKKGNPAADLLLERQYLVDKFHVQRHTTKYCDLIHEECRYHPDLPRFSGIQGVNTECAEQCFSWLKKFKDGMKYMTYYRFQYMLENVVNARNQHINRKGQ